MRAGARFFSREWSMAGDSSLMKMLPTRIARSVRLHARLAVAVVSALVLLALLPAAWRPATRLIVAWDAGAIIYLVSGAWVIVHWDVRRLRARAAEEDEGAVPILAIAVMAAIASLGAIIVLLGGVKNANIGDRESDFILAIATILLSWALVHAMFAFHYAHEFYGDGRDHRVGGLEFPGDDEPDYWDFVYFSFVIGMTFQVSDVQITGKHMRRLVVTHGIVSFIFSVSILALAVNIGSNLI
jgi:uncharacterized membrane protein